ncbi:PstS family phosphate ABC transporter substrate-binding protein [Caldisericum exile]|uniref:Phosphate-binding protein n=1 Tax=Caldisericum exile (strain DSM 21853 / NBRC 104410 / AZM16c01) TaxID=511051 RepID=A0A7U6GE65_CALEA|nr:PstS family phosphate ABC transporter substrate-binding protein [Caldisericum exile]BAL80725.1 phosphate ABC transporter phosphate-binding protein [Caldisericum exile AZM16c01]
MDKKGKFLAYLVIMGIVLAIAVSLTGCKQTSQTQEVKITMNGSTTVFPIAQKAAEIYMDKHPNVKISVEGTGSGNGIAALIDGTTDIANSSREIKTEEIEKAKAKGVSPYEIPIALDALSIVVNPANPITNLTRDQVIDIFTGKITNWKDLGWKDAPIVVVSRDTSSGTYGAFMELALPKDAKITDKAIYQSSNQTVKNTVATTEGAIGYIGLGYVDSSVKPVAYEGVMPSKENAINKTYKLSRHLYMYTNGQPQGEVKNFIDFVLSPEGQDIVESVGFIRIK